MPDFLNHPDNSIMANPSVTPEHIVPEWYFLLFYAVLRSVPNKEMGVILMVMSILFLIFFIFILKVLAGNLAVTITSLFRGGFAFILWFFVSICLLLLILGGLPVATPFLESAQLFTLFYFLQLSFLIPVSIWFSNLPLLKEIIGKKIIRIEDRILQYISERSKL
jgi:quinol-cytochrome oxidoreductase complex cytochrome b subunit